MFVNIFHLKKWSFVIICKKKALFTYNYLAKTDKRLEKQEFLNMEYTCNTNRENKLIISKLNAIYFPGHRGFVPDFVNVT